MEKKLTKFDVAIVADGNSGIGMGHIMRCSAIADALNNLGLDVAFITSDKDSHMAIRKLGFEAFCMETEYRTLSDQASKIKDWLTMNKAGFAFFDSYFASNDLFKSVSEVCPVGCFGYGKKYYYGMKLIVPYGASGDRQWYEEKFDRKEIKVLFGSRYVPLKRSYWNLPQKNVSEEPKRILLTNGGTDPLGISEAIIKRIRSQGIDLTIDAVLGRFYDVESIKRSCAGIPNLSFHEGLSDLAPLMEQADIAISAGGMTLYELMASSVPTIAYSFADNQVGNSLLDGGVVWCGDIRGGNSLDEEVLETIVVRLKELIVSYEKRKQLVEKGITVCDGRGAKRIAKEIEEIRAKNLILQNGIPG